MLTLTLDHNAVIDLEENQSDAVPLRRLLDLHATGHVCVRVVGIGASERQRGGGYAETFGAFLTKLDEAGLGGLEILKPPLIVGVSYLGWSIVISDAMREELQHLHVLLFPGIQFSLQDYCAQRGLDPNKAGADRRWRNAQCDVVALWSHICYKGDIFVTRDRNFLETKQAQLIALRAGQILRPSDAVVAAEAHSAVQLENAESRAWGEKIPGAALA